MILGHVDNLEQEGKFLPPALVKGLQYLKNNRFSEMSPGRYDIDGDALYAMVSEYETKPKAEKKPETHAVYADIQYIAAGEEVIGFGVRTAAMVVTEDRLKEKDVVFYAAVEKETEIKLSAGMYAVFFPWDVHRPGCEAGTKSTVRKVVLKVKMSQLG
ncbi:Hypothetical protein LUCI_2712 [Lucifera butyrica]|uniref:YhcH/YjgK/YiaL family protein n=1 Tax=Lucifera butyrica TaxID=1351585 RepID=A0A498RBE8_9FIRM|nr:YhcH/YjgK/YiaL family protein [Lucifera butyrica]VBB07463.1 Hypothetical protein LUCI_2712 [Lucifera butyrica]